MLSVICYRPDAPEDHHVMLTAFANGVNAYGDEARIEHLEAGYKDCDVAVVFGVRKEAVPVSWPRGMIFEEHHDKRKKDIVILERGYVRREDYYCAGWNGLNGRADHCNRGSPTDRWEALGIEMPPWRTSESYDYVLLCGQVPWDATVEKTDHLKWCRESFDTLCRATARPIIFRPHPKAEGVDYQIPTNHISRRPWEVDLLGGCHAVVTYNSTTGGLAAIDGVPVFAHDDTSMAWDVCTPDLQRIEEPARPDRTQWAANLAYAQWTEAEFAEGKAWAHLRKKFEDEAIFKEVEPSAPGEAKRVGEP